MDYPIKLGIVYLILFIFLLYSDEIIRKIKEIFLFKSKGKYIRECKECGTLQVKYTKKKWTSLRQSNCECNDYNHKLN
jgi:hypothetical protein